jgi:TolB-like protein
VELVDVGDGFRIWSESYDRELPDVFAIQEEIARTVFTRFPHRYRRWQDALTRVAELSEEWSR